MNTSISDSSKLVSLQRIFEQVRKSITNNDFTLDTMELLRAMSIDADAVQSEVCLAHNLPISLFTAKYAVTNLSRYEAECFRRKSLYEI